MNIQPNGGAYNDGAIAQAMIEIQGAVKRIEENMVYRHEYVAKETAQDQRISALERSPASAREWLGVLIAGLGCFGTLVLGGLSIVVTIGIAVATILVTR